MPDITFFNRNTNAGFSIRKVFKPVKEYISGQYKIKDLNCPKFGASPTKILLNLLFIFLNRNKKGINHVTGDIHYGILSLIGCKSVLTIHDLSFLENTKSKLDYNIKMIFWLKLPIKLSSVTTCISEHTKSEVLKHIKKDNLFVVHNALPKEYTYIPKKINSDKPVILHIGTGWNKNLENTILALSNTSCHLRIIGKLNDKQIDLLNKVGIDYSCRYNLRDEEILSEYFRCDFVNFPSLYEGFGMPILEGQAVGRVVVTSNLSPMKEISGDAVVYVDPNSIDSIKQAYQRILNDNAYIENLIDKGLQNAERYRQEKISREYIDIYKSILS